MSETFQTVKNIVGPTIILFGGTYFDLLDPEGSEFSIEDIAHSLSMTCRFVGHPKRFYSVAEHSVHVSRIVPRKDAFAALMHDAAEAFIGDVSKPLKTLLPEYKEIENSIEAAIFRKFGIDLPLPGSIKIADVAMLRSEQLQVMRNNDAWGFTAGSRPAGVMIECMTPDVAERAFMKRFHEVAP